MTILRSSERRPDPAAKQRKSPRQINAYRTTLIVRDTYHGHAEVTELIAALKQSIAPPPPVEEQNNGDTDEQETPQDPESKDPEVKDPEVKDPEPKDSTSSKPGQ